MITNLISLVICLLIGRSEAGKTSLTQALRGDFPKLTVEQTRFRQSMGLNEWDPLPEGVEYPEEMQDS